LSIQEKQPVLATSQRMGKGFIVTGINAGRQKIFFNCVKRGKITITCGKKDEVLFKTYM
jgi:hypothetical protein